MLPPFDGNGHATAAPRALVDIASTRSVAVSAQTLPDENASTCLFRKLGFPHAGATTDHEIGPAWRWLPTPNGRASRRQSDVVA